MISWAVSTAGILTGLTSQTGSYSNSSDFGGADAFGTTFDTLSAEGQFTAYTSLESGRSIVAETTIYNLTISSSYSLTDGASDSYSQTNSDPTTTAYSSAALSSRQSETSTTASASQTYAQTIPTTRQTEQYTSTTTGSGVSTTSLVSVTAETFTTQTASQSLTYDTTTTISGTMVATATAAVFKANTRNAEADVVFYVGEPTASWNGFSDAGEVGASATRTTLVPLVVTAQAPAHSIATTNQAEFPGQNPIPSDAVPTFSWSNASSSYAKNFVTSRTLSANTTTIADNDGLPQSTETATTTVFETTTSSLAVTLWNGSSGSCSNLEASTTTAQQFATSHRSDAVLTYAGPNLTWNTLETTTVSRSITTSTQVGNHINATNATSNFSTSYAQTVQKNVALCQPSFIVTAQQGAVTQVKFVPKCAVVGSSSGGFFSLNNGSFSDIVDYAKQARVFQSAVLPGEYDGYTASTNSNSQSAVTFTKTRASDANNAQTTTTESGLLLAAGASTTARLNETNATIFGGCPGFGETFVRAVGQGGAFINRVNRSTTSMSVGATTFSASVPVSCLEPITALVAQTGTGSTQVSPLVWAAPCNSTALPPVMPPNA